MGKPSRHGTGSRRVRLAILVALLAVSLIAVRIGAETPTRTTPVAGDSQHISETGVLVFLDADHSYDATVADIHWARSAGADVVCGHDYQPDWPGVIQAVDEAGGCARKVESLWVLAPLPVPLPPGIV